MTSKNVVSILMTAYNRQAFIREAIESVLESSYAKFELIVVDDCSTDNTASIAAEYARLDSRVKVYVNEKNLGDYPNRNRAASYAAGEFLLYVDSDDKLLPGALDNCIQMMMDNPGAGFGIYYPEPGVNHVYALDAKQSIRRQYLQAAFLQVGPGGLFMRRKFFKSLGGFPVEYGPANDMYFNVLAASKTTTLIFPFPPVYYRRHEGQELHNAYDYIHSNYRYNRDLILDLDLPLTVPEKKYILQKNKRRFIVNVFRYFLKSKNFRKTAGLFKWAEFTALDFFEGCFH